jgi:hypothetical protein
MTATERNEKWVRDGVGPLPEYRRTFGTDDGVRS